MDDHAARQAQTTVRNMIPCSPRTAPKCSVLCNVDCNIPRPEQLDETTVANEELRHEHLDESTVAYQELRQHPLIVDAAWAAWDMCQQVTQAHSRSWSLARSATKEPMLDRHDFQSMARRVSHSSMPRPSSPPLKPCPRPAMLTSPLLTLSSPISDLPRHRSRVGM
jgi:hypothetical protein